MAQAQKDTIYIDVDDEITSIVDKVKTSPNKIVALVLPKRATMLQSIVNMKLLKRTADTSKKQLVLITAEAGLLPLAGATGIYVAKTLQTKPAIPAPPKVPDLDDSVIDADAASTVDTSKSVGELAGLAAVASDPDAPIELDNTAAQKTGPLPAGVKPPKDNKNKKLKVPNFNRFRTKMMFAGLAVVLLIAGWYVAYYVLPKATVTITTDNTTTTSDMDITVDTAATTLDIGKKTVPATKVEVKKTESETVPATGQKDNGTKASGQVTLAIPCSAVGSVPEIPAGTGVSNGGLTYITQENAQLVNADFSNGCHFTDTSTVLSQEAGDKYNIEADRAFTVNGYSGVTGVGSAMTGGTSKIVKVVTTQDIDGAKQTLETKASNTATEELTQKLADQQLFAITETLVSGKPKYSNKPAVGAEASEVTVTSETTYTMLGVKEDDLKKLVEEDVKDEINTEQQSITDTGLSDAVFRLGTQPKSKTAMVLNMQTLVSAGAEIDVEALKTEIAGKKRGEIEQMIQSRPAVKDVIVEYSPFWIYSTPKNPGQITIVFNQASADGQ